MNDQTAVKITDWEFIYRENYKRKREIYRLCAVTIERRLERNKTGRHSPRKAVYLCDVSGTGT